MARQYKGHAELREHLRADLAGESTAVLEMTRLRAKRKRKVVGLDRGLHRADRGEWRVHTHRSILWNTLCAKQRSELLDELDRLVMVFVHLPVATDESRALCGHLNTLEEVRLDEEDLLPRAESRPLSGERSCATRQCRRDLPVR